MNASIRDGSDVEAWRIEEKELDANIAIKVHGGMVQAVYSDADVGVEVYDLDSSDLQRKASWSKRSSVSVSLMSRSLSLAGELYGKTALTSLWKVRRNCHIGQSAEKLHFGGQKPI